MRAVALGSRRRWRRWRSARRTVALLSGVGVLLVGCSQPAVRGPADPGRASTRPPAAGTSPTPTTASAASPTPSDTPARPRRGSGVPVHVSFFQNDGATYGVAMPIIAFFDTAPTDASAFDQATQVAVNGTPVHGAWYFERSSQAAMALEAHYRLADYWPAHATISMSLPVAGLWAGPGLVFDDSLTLTMHTGPAQVVQVDGTPGVDTMRVFSDGTLVRTLRVSLGAAKTPTYVGTAVVISKTNPQLMQSTPGEPYFRIEVPWSVRVTYDGEFIHDAYWNNQLGQVNLSHGCTNLAPADARWYYGWSQIGDPVTWVHTGTNAVLAVWDGWGDWNASFAQYAQGGLLHP